MRRVQTPVHHRDRARWRAREPGPQRTRRSRFRRDPARYRRQAAHRHQGRDSGTWDPPDRGRFGGERDAAPCCAIQGRGRAGGTGPDGRPDRYVAPGAGRPRPRFSGRRLHRHGDRGGGAGRTSEPRAMVRRANHLRLGRRDVRPERRDGVRGRHSGQPVREHHSRGGGRAVIQASARWLSAEEAMGQVRAGDLDPQAVVQAHLDAIDRFEERIHAYIHVDRAARSTSGVTLAVKDSLPVAGMPYTYGTTSWRDRIADEDAVPVARARAAGMAILGKTNLPELAASIGTSNTIFPPTQNPWRDGITPGGSSGGSGAAVAAGMASVALGGDTGGSIRIPASCCGVVGLRPTPDRIPSEEVDATVLQSRGPMTRTVADARLLFSVMTATRRGGVSSKRRLLIGTAFAGADPACQAACRRAAKSLENAGHEIQEIKWDPEDRKSTRLNSSHRC